MSRELESQLIGFGVEVSAAVTKIDCHFCSWNQQFDFLDLYIYCS